jgi:hypothetical protein
MSHSQSPRGALGKKPAFQASNGSRARPLDFDVDLELDIDWEGIGFASSPSRPSPVPASTTKLSPTCDNAPVSRISEKQPAPEPDRAPAARSEEDEAPTRVYVARESEAAPAPAPVPESPRAPANSTLVMDHAELMGKAPPASFNSGQTLVMTREQLRGQPPAHEELPVVTKVMSMEQVVGRHAAPEREFPSDSAIALDDESGPHTKMMPIDVLMKRANAQQRWPLPGVQVRAEVRDSQPSAAGGRSFFLRLGEGWRKTSLVRKVSLFLMPLLCALILVRYTKILGGPKSARSKKAVPAASVARPAALPRPSATPAGTTSASLGEPSAAVAAAGAPTASSPATAPPASAARLDPSTEPSAAVTGTDSPPPARAASSNGVTRQRKAADAVAEGDYPAAVERYRSLAREEPGVPAYREAARILEERANGARR